MEESSSLTLNLVTGAQPFEKRSKESHEFDDFKPEKAPLVTFVNPKVKSAVNGMQGKPAFRLIRKKAVVGVRKTLTDMKMSTDKPMTAISHHSSLPSKSARQSQAPPPTLASSAGITSVPDGTKVAAVSRPRVERNPPRKTQWNVTEHKATVKSSAGVISSLFVRNPEIPVVAKEVVDPAKEDVFSSRGFTELKIHKHLIATLEKDLALTQMTEAQSRTIPILLDKRDALVKSQTGSGKTLAYAIPIVEKLQSITPHIDRTSGVFALVIVPTRELVLQTYSWFIKILKPFTWVVPGYLIGGEKKKSEKARIRKGMNILISTPGRLLDHLSSTQNLNLGRLHWLVMDEADRLFDMGYEKDVAKILSTAQEHFSKEGSVGRRQNVMLSATLSNGVEKLAGLALSDPERINMSEDGSVNQDQLVMPTNLKQWYIIVPPKLRLVTLAAFILWKCTITSEKKILIFMTTQDSVDYHAELFNRVLANRPGKANINIHKLHGSMAQKDRTAIFKEFRDTESGVLLCTDVAARGLDLPSVDWIVQYNPPVTAEDYVHRVGRTARIGKCGEALIFLAPSETEFVSRLAKRGIAMAEKNPDVVLKTLIRTYARVNQSLEQTATSLQLAFEDSVIESYNLYEMATKGYVSYIRSYAAFPKDVRDVFNFQSLHLGHYAKSFALRDPPTRINSIGRAGQRNDRTEKFRTARQRNPAAAVKRAAAATTGSEEPRKPNFYERKAMMSEFASGLDYPPAKKAMKSRQQEHRDH